MTSAFNMYPMLTPELTDKSVFSAEGFEFSYTEDNENFSLNLDEINGIQESFSACLRDPRCVWYPDSNNLIVRKSGTIENPAVLFGVEGIAVSDAVIGAAIIWISSKSDQRGVIPCGHFVAKTKKFEFSTEYQFDKSSIKGSLQLQLVLYLKKSGTVKENEQHLNNTSGTIYGVIEQCEIYTDGNGSIFPIATVNEPGKPLWWVYYNETADPMNDYFDEENVEIRLNKAHPHFDSLKIDVSLKESPLFVEVLSSALMVIINSVRENLGPDWESTIASRDFSHGSIAEAIYYFIHKLQWDITSQTNISKSIHTYFDKSL